MSERAQNVQADKALRMVLGLGPVAWGRPESGLFGTAWKSGRKNVRLELDRQAGSDLQCPAEPASFDHFQLDLFDAVDGLLACRPQPVGTSNGITVEVEDDRQRRSGPSLPGWGTLCQTLARCLTEVKGEPGLLLVPEAWRGEAMGFELLDAWHQLDWTVLPAEPVLRQQRRPTPRLVAASQLWLRIVEPDRSLVVPASSAVARALSALPVVLQALIDRLEETAAARWQEAWSSHRWWIEQRVLRGLSEQLAQGKTELTLRGIDLLRVEDEAQAELYRPILAARIRVRLLPESLEPWYTQLSSNALLTDPKGGSVQGIRWSERETILLKDSPLNDLRTYLKDNHLAYCHLDPVRVPGMDDLLERHQHWLHAQTQIRDAFSSLKRNLAAASEAQLPPLPADAVTMPPAQETADLEAAPEAEPGDTEPAPLPVASTPAADSDATSETAAAEAPTADAATPSRPQTDPKPSTRPSTRESTKPSEPASEPWPGTFDPLDAFEPNILVLDTGTHGGQVPPERLTLVVNGKPVVAKLQWIEGTRHSVKYQVVHPKLRHGDVVRVDIEAPLEGEV